MTDAVRLLNDRGVSEFREFITQTRTGQLPPVPRHLLTESAHSVDALFAASVERQPLGRPFSSAYELGEYLNRMLTDAPKPVISRDYRLWNWLALYYFDELCPVEQGARALREDAAYVLGSSYDYRRYYRHLVRSAWVSVEVHRLNARVLLTPMTSSRPTAAPAAVRTDIPMQLSATQAFVESRSVIEAACILYFDGASGRLKKGSTGKGPGSPRRLVSLLNQLDLTYDLHDCPGHRLVELLPREFDRFRT